MQSLVTVSLRTGIAMPDGGYSPVLVGYMGEKINEGAPVLLSDGPAFAAQQSGFMLHANEAGSSIKVLVYDDAVSGICACIIPPSEACDLRQFSIDAALLNLRALELYKQELLSPEEPDAPQTEDDPDTLDSDQQIADSNDHQQIEGAGQSEDHGNQQEQSQDDVTSQTEQGA